MRCPACGNENREGARFCDSCGADLHEAAAAGERAQPDIPPRGSLPGGAPVAVSDGRYRIRDFLGQGGRKHVYLADDTQEQTEVAVALFDTAGVAAAVQSRARREAEAMRKLGDHPHVVRVHDSGEEEGNPFIVSEYMPGGDVETLLAAEGGQLPIDRAIAIATDVTRALEHAHACGIVHRDLKPANVWLDDDGHARLGDFGLATTEGRARVSGGTLVGTVAYLPPEQALGEAAGPESDLYSLGALLYEMLTGQPPFPGDDAVSIISQHLHADPVPASRHRPEIPEALDRVIGALLAKRREDRPGSAAEARAALEAALEEPAPTQAPEPAVNPLDSLAGGVFVGRERELEQMREAVDGAVGGHGRLLLLTGEPGIGKTRAAEELATYARVSGAKAYWGRCREDEGAPAYWPWVQAIRSYVRDADPVALAWHLGGGAPDVAQLVPEVAERLDIEPADDTDSEEARFRVFDSVTNFLVSAARDRPMVLVLDDLHWADEPSLLLLRFAARELGDSGLLIVGTYRDVELGRQHPLARVLSEISGLEDSRRLNLRGLDTRAVERYVEMTSGSSSPPGLAEAVMEQTDGNPFFVGEVVRLLASEGRLRADAAASWEPSIPQGVREVLGRRLDRLSEETNKALSAAAAVGREFEVEVLVRTAGLSPDQLMTAANEAVAERLVTGCGPGRFMFSHALVRDTLYDELSPAQRSKLHERIGRALEEICGDDPEPRLGELAHHFLAAGSQTDGAKAIDYAERAGRRAMEKLAYEEAAELYERALEVLELADESAPDEDTRCRLLIALGEAQTKAARFGDAKAALERAAASARALDDPDRFIRVVLDMGYLSEAGIVDERVVELCEEALDWIGPEKTTRRAQLLATLSQELYWVDAQERSAPLAREAAELARELGDDATLAQALHRVLFIPYGPDSSRERLEIAGEMLELGRACGDREMVMRSHAYRLREFLEQGDISAVDEELNTYARLADELRMPQHIWHTYALRGTRALIAGDIAQAEELAEEARRRGERAEQPVAAQFYGVQLLQIRRFQGRAGELLPVVRDLAERYPLIPAWRTAVISLEAWVGNVERGRVEMARFAGDDLDAAVPLDINRLTSLGLLGEAVGLLRDERWAGELYERLLPYDGSVIVAARAAGCNGPVSRILGLLADVQGRSADAERHFGDAIQTTERMGDRLSLSLTRIDLARVLLAHGRGGDRERALELLGEALSTARELGARALVERGLELRLEAQGLAGVDVTTSIDDLANALETEKPDLRAHAAPDGTVAILFSDIEDSTIITERLGDERWLEVLREHNAIFREQIERYDGFEVKSQGDGFMLAFPDPCRALEYAIAIQRAFSERERDGSDEALRVRIGLHTGEVIAEEGDFFGKNVILAARIAAQANGGEILVSEGMREAAQEHDSDGRDGTELRFDEGRDLELKGLAGMHTVYRAEWDLDQAAASA